MLSVTSAQLREAAPGGTQVIIDAIASQSGRVFHTYGLTNRSRILAFLSTALEESGFRTLTENLNYTAERAHEVWPHVFPTAASAVPYASSPQRLANKVYGGRMGNTNADDGWRYRGQGLIQITGRNNFAMLEKRTGLPLLDHPEMVTDQANMLECSVALFVCYPSILTLADRGAWKSVWALVGSGRADGPVINLTNHEAALSRLDHALPALVDDGVVLPAPPPATIPVTLPRDTPTPPVPPPDAPLPRIVPPPPSLWERFLLWLAGLHG